MSEKIIGQSDVVKEISKILDIFVASNAKIRPHFILAGSSGSGKSYSIKSLCKEKDIQMVEINAAQITKEGTSGNSLSKSLSPLANYKHRNAVVFVDEFDKLFISNNTNSSLANEITTGVQNEFLKILESNTTQVYGEYGKYYDIDISRVLFVFAGAFNNEERVTIDKLRNFGVKTEFLGRVGLVYNTNKLTLEDLFMILDNSDLLDIYLKLFDGVKREDVVSVIREYLTANYENNTLGARIINTLINQYFIKGGTLGSDDVEEIMFQTKLELD